MGTCPAMGTWLGLAIPARGGTVKPAGDRPVMPASGIWGTPGMDGTCSGMVLGTVDVVFGWAGGGGAILAGVKPPLAFQASREFARGAERMGWVGGGERGERVGEGVGIRYD